MTEDEAIKEICQMATTLQIPPSTKLGKALWMAIEALKKIKEENQK